MKLIIKILIHSIFWLVFIVFNNYFSPSDNPASWPRIADMMPNYFVNMTWAVTVFYTFYFYMIRFFGKRYFVKYLFLSVLTCIAATVVFLAIHRLFLPGFNTYENKILFPAMAGTFLIAQCGSLVRGFEDWFADMQLKSELENINLRNELELLKARINPHFLFNTLNNIDSLIYKSPDAASNALLTLSEMLRYMVYETKNDLMPLEKEIGYIQSYIALQQMRFRDPECISFTFDENCKSILFPPGLLLVFIENAFKYVSDTGRKRAIEIKLLCRENEMNFRCSNYYNPAENINKKTGGIGLGNVKRQLAILYPDNHSLRISEDNNIFVVDLTIRPI
ncbi:MAG: sensor histidine kinase [Bacteroidota bacterium]